MHFQKTEKNLNEISISVHDVSSLLLEISNASIEQSMGLEQINTAVCSLDETTQRNSAIVSENYSLSSSLNMMAENLRGMVGTFKLYQNHHDE